MRVNNTISVTGLLRTARTVNGKAKNANINMGMINASKYDGVVSKCARNSADYKLPYRAYSLELLMEINRVSLRAATELFSARIDQLCQFIQEKGLQPPPMNPEDEAGMNKVLDTLQIARGLPQVLSVPEETPSRTGKTPPLVVGQSPSQSPPAVDAKGQNPTNNVACPGPPGVQDAASSGHFSSPEGWSPFGMVRGASDNQNFVHWGFTLPTAESLDTIYANHNSGLAPGAPAIPAIPVNADLSPGNYQLGIDMVQQPGVLLDHPPQAADHDSESDEGDEAENDVIEQLSHRIGTLKIAGDGHLRFYGATSNLNLVDVSATQQRQRPDARTVRHDGQDILNHLRVGQPVDQALEDHLVELYFTWQNPSIYVVDKEMFMTARSKWRNEFDDTPFYSEVLANAM